ncbi:MAG TPA: TIR domain-containing protein [Candidatus Limnocylindrales bacterium]|nr:TIR domain-containing protein [Candidatus Limnocylindrales bacterium]
MRYDAFISYSHAADGELAPSVQRGLQRLARPWHRRRALEVFRDQTGLAVTPALWSAIRTALDQSDYFVLLASPEAAASRWVNQEIEHWLAGHSVNRLLPVVTGGDWVWNSDEGDFDWPRSTAVPPALRGVFVEEPRHLDLRWARSENQLDLRHGRFRDAITELAAPMHGMTKENLDSEDVTQHRRVIRLRRGVVAALCVLLLLVTGASVAAVHNLRVAAAAADDALAQQLRAEAERRRAAEAAEEARRQQQIAEAEQKRAEAAAEEARRQQLIAEAEQKRAEAAAAEALRQGRIAHDEEAKAVRAAAEAQRQNQIAEAEQKRAEAAAAEAERQRRIAESQLRLATARQLVAKADSVRDNDPRTALMLGIAARQVNPDGETQASLVNTLTATRYRGTLSGHTDSVGAVAFSPDGRTLATGSDDGTVILWNMNGQAADRRLGQPLTGHTDSVSSVAFSPDGRTLATGSHDRTAMLWDVSDRTAPQRLGGPLLAHHDPLPGDPSGWVSAVAFAPDGRTLATASYDRTVMLWDISDRTAPKRLVQLRHTDSVAAMTIAPDGRTLAATQAHSVVLWDLTDLKAVKRLGEPLTGHTGYMNSVAFASDGRTLATADTANEVILWDISDRAIARRVGQPLIQDGGPVTVAFAPDGRRLAAAGGTSRTVVLWDVSDRTAPRRVGPPLTSHMSWVNAVAFAPDGRTLATGAYDNQTLLWDVFDLGSPTPVGTPFADTDRDWDPVIALAYSPDGRTLASAGSYGGEVVLRDVSDRSAPRRIGELLGPYPVWVTAVEFSADGRTLATYQPETGTVFLWDVSNPAALRGAGQPLTDTGGVAAMTFAPDGPILATAEIVYDGSATTWWKSVLTLWDLSDPTAPRRTGEPVHLDGWPAALAFAPDGHTLAVGSAGNDIYTVTMWDVSNRAAPRRIGQPLTGVDLGAFSPDGRTLATSDVDRAIILWDVSDRAAPRRRSQPLRHPDSLLALAFSPDGRTLATGGLDHTVTLWDVSDPAGPRRLGEPLTGHTGWVTALAFAPDGRTLAAGSWDHTTILWDLTPLNDLRSHATERACAITGRGLDRDEWARYIPGLPYQNTCP